MTANDDITKQHDIEDLVDVNTNDPETPENVDDEQTEVGSNSVDYLYKEAFGNDPDGKTIKQAVDEDEVAIEKDLEKDQQKSSKS